MLINKELVAASVGRASRSRLNPMGLANKLGDGDRSTYTTKAQRQARYSQLLAESGNAQVAQTALERLIGGNDLVSVNYLMRGAFVARSICRIRLRNASGNTVGFGTGFLIAPGILLTNHHVIPSAAEAAHAQAEFDYELDANGTSKIPVVFSILSSPAPITSQPLDFCIAALSTRSIDGKHDLNIFGYLPLSPTPGKAFVGEYLTIIQHPNGERKQICVRENKLLKFDENAPTLWYQTDTVAGSSGSPVFNGSWQVVALHHSGVPKTDKQGRWLTIDGRLWDNSMDESKVAWLANEGIRISRIVEFLQKSYSGDPLSATVVAQSTTSPSFGEARSLAAAGVSSLSNGNTKEIVDGEMQVTIPLRISIRVGDLTVPHFNSNPSSTAQPAPFQPATMRSPPSRPLSGALTDLHVSGISGPAIESVNIDQSNYTDRTGYDPKFLGATLPLPALKTAALQKKRLKLKGGGFILKYWNYSVMMHAERQLAFYSVVNVDSKLRPTSGGRDGDRWYYDPRCPQKEDQLGPEFYGQQSTFEANREKNPFDRGHLTRRLDAQWGRTESQKKRNGDDSFHWSNCSPQHYLFNQGSKQWLGLEDYVISTFAKETGKATVFNGPVFDAPLSKIDADGRVTPDITGKTHPDPTFGDVAIPKLFYKIVACRKGRSGLAVAAFLLSQEEFLLTMDRLHGMPPFVEEKLSEAEARLFQVRVTDIERITGLDFGPLSKHDIGIKESANLNQPLLITALDDLRL